MRPCEALSYISLHLSQQTSHGACLLVQKYGQSGKKKKDIVKRRSGQFQQADFREYAHPSGVAKETKAAVYI